jgi:glycine hydroxymethyltransferase
VTQTNLDFLADTDPVIAGLLQEELQRQRDHLELIASENFTSALPVCR